MDLEGRTGGRLAEEVARVRAPQQVAVRDPLALRHRPLGDDLQVGTCVPHALPLAPPVVPRRPLALVERLGGDEEQRRLEIIALPGAAHGSQHGGGTRHVGHLCPPALAPARALHEWLRAVVAHVTDRRVLTDAFLAAYEGPVDIEPPQFAAWHKALFDAGRPLLAAAQDARPARPDPDIAELLALR